MKRNIDIVHIYYGSQGIGGLYINEIYQSLKSNSLNQSIVVSNYYPFTYGKKIFFKYSDLSGGMKNSFFRKLIRIFEMLFGLIYCLFFIMIKKPKIINYSLNASFITDVIFIKLLKKISRSTIIVTCHDVIPFSKNPKDKFKQIKYRQIIFNTAHFLLVHTEKSIEDLIEVFKISRSKILIHSFPLMSLKSIFGEPNCKTKKYDFAFIGHLRNEKGIDILIEAWKRFITKFPKATLLIAGNAPYQIDFLKELKRYNVTLELQYLSDRKYFDYINSANTVVLPYKEGTNSGVAYNLFDLDVNIIYSDLPMFMENKLLDRTGMFESENVEDLEKKLEQFYNRRLTLDQDTANYKVKFDKEVYDIYSGLLV